MSTNKVIIVGASGYIGKATLAALTSRHSETLQAHAGVRNPEKFGQMDKVETVEADMGDKDALTQALKGFDSVFLVVPGHEQRTAPEQLALHGIAATKQDAGVKFVLLLLVSVLTSGTDSFSANRSPPPRESQGKWIGLCHHSTSLVP